MQFSVFLQYGIQLFKKHSRIFPVMGDERTNQNPAILAFGILFFRWHNKLALKIQEQHPDWGDEDVFQRARRTVIAHLQVSIAKL